jgi:hypothetical protein
MGKDQIDAVVAGSKSFALALFAPLTERVGVRPRIASDPAQAGALLPGDGGLAVVEYAGEDTLRAIEALLRRPGVRVVAAVPAPLASAEDRLRALGAEAARWDGTTGGILGAVARQLAPPPSATPPPAVDRTANAPGPAARVAPPVAQPPPARNEASAAAPSPAVVPAPSQRSAQPALVPAAAPASAAVLERLQAASAPPAAPPAPAGWPSGGPAPAELEDALARGIAGLFDAGSPLGPVTEAVVHGLSPLERDVVSGAATPAGAEVVRRAALMRLEVAAALATAPAPGASVDAGAVSATLGKIDGLLSEVGALIQSASPQEQGSLEAMRNALVKEAIDFSEAVQRLAPSDAAVAPKVRAAVARARVLSVDRGAEKGRRASRGLVVALVLCALGAAAFHAVRLARSDAPAPMPSLSGAPSDSIALAGRARTGAPGATIVRSTGGRAFTQGEIAALAESEALKGNTVKQLAPDVLAILPPAQPGSSTDAK